MPEGTDMVSVLVTDHEEMKQFFRELEATTDAKARREAADKLTWLMTEARMSAPPLTVKDWSARSWAMKLSRWLTAPVATTTLRMVPLTPSAT